MRLRLAVVCCLLIFGLTLVQAALPADMWEAEMRRFDALDRKRPTAAGGVVFVGSSSIRLWDLEESFPKAEALNRGFGGSELADSVRYLDRLVLRHEPRVVVLYAGDNDIARGKTPEQVNKDFEAFIAAVRKDLPETKIVYIAIKPSIARWKLAETMQKANAEIAATCAKHKNCEFVDVWPAMLKADGLPNEDLFVWDGLHMSDAGYEVWSKLVAPQIGEPGATPVSEKTGN
ncbi:MAG: hypothetical protein H0T47_20935 [Planctomycetaceae bacterium]|nr:hypothetical protein [Planctomycetaceae bacterium]